MDAKAELGIDQKDYPDFGEKITEKGVADPIGDVSKQDPGEAAKQLGLIRDKQYDMSAEGQEIPRGVLGAAAAKGTSLDARRRRMDDFFNTQGMKDAGAAWRSLSGQGT